MDLLTQKVYIYAPMKTPPFPYPRGSLFFAPMEGVTDEAYRLSVMDLFPEWDAFATDFLRVPTVGHYSDEKILMHFGEQIYKDEKSRNKTLYQILTTAQAQTEFTVKQIKELGIHHLDLNLGCPSKKVNSHGGGAFLLSDLKSLKKIIQTIRIHFTGTFTVKIRVGYRDDKNFIDCLKLFEDEGVEGITVHARTRDQLYKGVADWKYIKIASETVNIPIIGNGDIWNIKDIERVFDYSNCHSLMLARSALKTPWIARLYKEKTPDSLEIRKHFLKQYFNVLRDRYRNEFDDEQGILRRFKAISRYLFDDFPNGILVKSQFLRAKSLQEFDLLLNALSS